MRKIVAITTTVAALAIPSAALADTGVSNSHGASSHGNAVSSGAQPEPQ